MTAIGSQPALSAQLLEAFCEARRAEAITVQSPTSGVGETSDSPLPDALERLAATRVLLRTDEAAEALGISRTQVYALIRRQILQSVRIEGSRRIPLVCIYSYVDRLRRERNGLGSTR